MKDTRMHAPATARNSNAILLVLRQFAPEAGTMLEIASGTGEHTAYFSQVFSNLRWQPTDIAPNHLASIDAHVRAVGVRNVDKALWLDVRRWPWPVEAADGILNCNMIHISPWATCVGLMKGAGALLPQDGPLILYGPFKRDGEHTAPSNERFDAGLKAENPDWGVRDLADVCAEAEKNGLFCDHIEEMPANNLTVIFRKD